MLRVAVFYASSNPNKEFQIAVRFAGILVQIGIGPKY